MNEHIPSEYREQVERREEQATRFLIGFIGFVALIASAVFAALLFL